MRSYILPLTACLLAPLAIAQNVRQTQQIDNSSTAFDPAVATAGDLSVFAYAGDNSIYVSTSDGRGLNWSTPVRLDGDATGARKDLEGSRGAIGISGNNVYVLWRDQRSGGDELYLAVSNDGGTTFGPEQLVSPAAGALVVDWRLAVTDLGGTDAVYVLYTQGSQDLFLTASTDGGSTFSTPSFVPAGIVPGAADADDIDLAADARTVYVTWQDNRLGGDTLWFQKSTDAGATFLPVDINVSGGSGTEDVDGDHCMSVAGSTVAVLWSEEPTGSGNEVLRASVSTNGGTGFNAPVPVGNYTAGTDDVDNPVCRAQAGTNNILAVWEDNRSGSDLVYAAVSSDGGNSWGSETAVSGSAGFPRVAGAGDVFVVSWTSGSFPNSAEAAISYNAGASWQPQVTTSATSGDADFAEGAYNVLYDNFIAGWLADDNGTNNAYVAGFRAATVVNDGWGTSQPTLDFDLSGFDSPVAVVGISLGTGPFAIPADGRMVDLTADSLFLGSLGEPIYTAALTGGSGSTPTVSNVFNNIPTIGITVNYVAFGLNGGAIGRITDADSFDL